MTDMEETSVHRYKLAIKNRMFNKTKGWFEGRHLITVFNTTEPILSGFTQQGRVANITINKLVYKVFGAGKDKGNLGRWAWTRFQVKEGKRLRGVTVYRPGKAGTQGSGTVHAQHLRFLQLTNNDKTPREAMMEDLKVEIEK